MRILVILAFFVVAASADSVVHNVPSSYEGGTKWELFGDGQTRRVPQVYSAPVPVMKQYEPKPFYNPRPFNYFKSSSDQDFFKKHYEVPTFQQPMNIFRSAPFIQPSQAEQQASQYLPPQNYGYHYEKPVYKYYN